MDTFNEALRRGLTNRPPSDNNFDISTHSTKSLNIQNPPATLDNYGEALFKGAVAAPYLRRAGLPEDILISYEWTMDGNADRVRL